MVLSGKGRAGNIGLPGGQRFCRVVSAKRDYAAYYGAFMEICAARLLQRGGCGLNNASLDGDGLAVVGTGGWIGGTRWISVRMEPH